MALPIFVETTDEGVKVTRYNMRRRLSVHTIQSPYTAAQIAEYLRKREDGTAGLIQDELPEMRAEDREFLITGITPSEWNHMFGGDEQ